MSSPRTAARRNLDAEVRAVEEGHRAFVDGASIVVVSDTHHGKRYRVHAHAGVAGSLITFQCAPEGNRCYSDDHLATAGAPGVTPCKHAALAARRLEREGLAELDADFHWTATPLAGQLAPAPAPVVEDDDPFAGIV